MKMYGFGQIYICFFCENAILYKCAFLSNDNFVLFSAILCNFVRLCTILTKSAFFVLLFQNVVLPILVLPKFWSFLYLFFLYLRLLFLFILFLSLPSFGLPIFAHPIFVTSYIRSSYFWSSYVCVPINASSYNCSFLGPVLPVKWGGTPPTTINCVNMVDQVCGKKSQYSALLLPA